MPCGCIAPHTTSECAHAFESAYVGVAVSTRDLLGHSQVVLVAVTFATLNVYDQSSNWQVKT